MVNVNDIANDEQESNNPLKNTFSNGPPADPKTLEFEKSLAEMFQKILTEEAPAQGMYKDRVNYDRKTCVILTLLLFL